MAAAIENDAPYTSLADRAYATLQGEITAGHLPPGTVLDRRSIAERLGMSTIPVLEAIRRLEKDGLVESRPRWPARVVVHDEESIRGDYALREALSAQVARLCVEQATDAELRELSDLGREVDGLLSDPAAATSEGPRRHLAFHQRFGEICRCPALVAQLEVLNRRILMRRNWTRATLRRSYPPDWHSRLADAVATRDLLKADEAARAHVKQGLQDELEALRVMRANA